MEQRTTRRCLPRREVCAAVGLLPRPRGERLPGSRGFGRAAADRRRRGPRRASRLVVVHLRLGARLDVGLPGPKVGLLSRPHGGRLPGSRGFGRAAADRRRRRRPGGRAPPPRRAPRRRAARSEGRSPAPAARRVSARVVRYPPRRRRPSPPRLMAGAPGSFNLPQADSVPEPPRRPRTDVRPVTDLPVDMSLVVDAVMQHLLLRGSDASIEDHHT